MCNFKILIGTQRLFGSFHMVSSENKILNLESEANSLMPDTVIEHAFGRGKFKGTVTPSLVEWAQFFIKKKIKLWKVKKRRMPCDGERSFESMALTIAIYILVEPLSNKWVLLSLFYRTRCTHCVCFSRNLKYHFNICSCKHVYKYSLISGIMLKNIHTLLTSSRILLNEIPV